MTTERKEGPDVQTGKAPLQVEVDVINAAW